MRFSYTIEGSVVRSYAKGTITQKDLQDYLLVLLKDDRYVDAMKEICDLREAELDMSMKDVYSYAQFMKTQDTHFEGCSLAIITSSDLLFGLGRIYYSLTNSLNLQKNIFRSIEQAEKWLEINPAKAS